MLSFSWFIWLGLALAHETNVEEEEVAVEPDSPLTSSCAELPEEAMTALTNHYETVSDARTGEYWGASPFAWNKEEDSCYPWGLDWVVFSYGGVQRDGRPNVERHLWSDDHLYSHGRTGVALNVEPERGMLRIDTTEGGPGWHWVQRSWYSREGGWHRVASMPASVGSDSSPFRIESHFEFEVADLGERLLTVRYFVPNVGIESTIIGTLSSLSGDFEWSGSGDLYDSLMVCNESPTQGCPLYSLVNWVGDSLGEPLPTSDFSSGPTRPIQEVAGEFTVLQAITDPPEHQAAIDQVLRSRNSQLIRCYERSTRGGSQVGRRFVATFDIEGGRIVSTEINGSSGSSWLDSCFVRRLESSRYSGVDAMLALYLSLGESE